MRYTDIKDRTYIRFGDIPADERSGIGKSPNFIKHLSRSSDFEVGVSVFDASWSEDRHRWEIIDVGNFATLDALLTSKRLAYLVKGKVVGTGIDDETLLRNVEIIASLDYSDIWVRGWGNDGACEDFLFDDITEAFDTKISFSWEDHSNEDLKLIQAKFQIADGLFVVQFKMPYFNPGLWELSFTRNETLDLTGTGSATTVLSTVMAIVREFISDLSPTSLTFAAKNDEGSRNKLYPILMAMLQREFPAYVSRDPKKRRTHTTYQVDAPRKPYIPPEPKIIEPLVEPEYDQDALNRFMDEFEAEYQNRRSR